MSQIWENNNLKRYREERGMTQKELAEKLKVTQPAIQKWEKGSREPNLQNVMDICKVLDITIEQLLKTK